MVVSVEVISLDFSGKTRPDAYKNAMSFYLRNIIGQNINHTTCEVKDSENDGDVRLTIYVTLDMDEISDYHCKVCKEVSNQIYGPYHGNCVQCHAKGLRKRISDLMKERVEYVKTRIG